MIKGVFIALGIIVVSLLIPLVHFVAFPASPFIGGYFGIKFAQVPRESYAAKCLLFGALLGSLFLILVSPVAVLVVTLSDLGQRFLIWVLVGVLTLYTGSMSALGAMFGGRADPVYRQHERPGGDVLGPAVRCLTPKHTSGQRAVRGGPGMRGA